MTAVETKIVWACTYVEKLVDRDHYDHGCEARPRCLMSERCDIKAATLPKLLETITERLNLHDGTGARWLVWPEEGRADQSQMECGDCTEPTKDEYEQWEKGEFNLYLCDYTFSIEKRVVTNRVDQAELTELDAAGVKWELA